MKLQRDMKFNGKHFKPKSMMRVDYKGESFSLAYSLKMKYILSLGECIFFLSRNCMVVSMSFVEFSLV